MVISDWDVKFTSKFWKSLFAGLETKINFSTSYHPETDGQTERTNQVNEDMLRMYVMERPTKWEDLLVGFLVSELHNITAAAQPHAVPRKARLAQWAEE